MFSGFEASPESTKSTSSTGYRDGSAERQKPYSGYSGLARVFDVRLFSRLARETFEDSVHAALRKMRRLGRWQDYAVWEIHPVMKMEVIP